MTDAPQTPPTRGLRPWLRWVLIASLALNLAVLGVMGGAAWRFHSSDRVSGRLPWVDHVSLAYMRAFEREDSRAIRQDMRAALPPRAETIAQSKASFAPIVQMLRAPAFSAPALRAALARQMDPMVQRQRLAQQVAVERIAQMSPSQRAAFADRLEQAVADLGQFNGHPPHRPAE